MSFESLNGPKKDSGATGRAALSVTVGLLRTDTLSVVLAAVLVLVGFGLDVLVVIAVPGGPATLVQLGSAVISLLLVVSLSEIAVRRGRGESGKLTLWSGLGARAGRILPLIGWGLLVSVAAGIAAVVVTLIGSLLGPVGAVIALVLVLLIIWAIAIAGLSFTLNGPGFDFNSRSFGFSLCVAVFLLLATGIGAGLEFAGLSTSTNAGSPWPLIVVAVVEPVCGLLGVFGFVAAALVAPNAGIADEGTVLARQEEAAKKSPPTPPGGGFTPAPKGNGLY